MVHTAVPVLDLLARDNPHPVCTQRATAWPTMRVTRSYRLQPALAGPGEAVTAVAS